MSLDLNLLDFAFITVILISIVLGIIKGFVRELFSLAFFIIAVILSFLFYAELGNMFFGSIKNRDIANFAAFASIFIGVLIVGSLVTYSLKRLFVIGPLKAVDRILGAAFGLVRGILICGILVFGLIVFPIHDKLVKESQMCPYIIETVDIFLKLLPEKFRDKIDIFYQGNGQKDHRTERTV